MYIIQVSWTSTAQTCSSAVCHVARKSSPLGNRRSRYRSPRPPGHHRRTAPLRRISADRVVGATVATVAVFVPVYLFVVVPGKWFRKHERHPRLQGFVKGATTAAAGAIAGAAIVIARQTIGGWLSIAIGLVALALLLQKRIRAPEPAIVALAALAGILLHD